MSDKQISVGFVCLGNICRSPMAEAVFQHQVKTSNLSNKFHKIDSFGTGSWHTGENPDRRTISCCKKHGVGVNHKAQTLKSKHFDQFDYLFCMDESNLYEVRRLKPAKSSTKVCLFGDYRISNEFNREIEDPYYGSSDGFQLAFDQSMDFTTGFLKSLEK